MLRLFYCRLNPLTSVFKPLLIDDQEVLAREAPVFSREIRTSTLVDESVKSRLLEVFVDWMQQRFSNLSFEELEAMFVGELPDMTETRLGKDLIEIGHERGERKGLIEGIVMLLESRQEKLPESLQSELDGLSVSAARLLMAALIRDNSIESLRSWLDSNVSGEQQPA